MPPLNLRSPFLRHLSPPLVHHFHTYFHHSPFAIFTSSFHFYSNVSIILASVYNIQSIIFSPLLHYTAPKHTTPYYTTYTPLSQLSPPHNSQDHNVTPTDTPHINTNHTTHVHKKHKDATSPHHLHTTSPSSHHFTILTPLHHPHTTSPSSHHFTILTPLHHPHTTSPSSHHFTILTTTTTEGEIRTTKRIDREEMCVGESECSILYDVSLTTTSGVLLQVCVVWGVGCGGVWCGVW